MSIWPKHIPRKIRKTISSFFPWLHADQNIYSETFQWCEVKCTFWSSPFYFDHFCQIVKRINQRSHRYHGKVFQKTPSCLCQYTENVIWNIFYTDGEVRSNCWWDALYFSEITSALIEISVMLDLCVFLTHIDERQWRSPLNLFPPEREDDSSWDQCLSPSHNSIYSQVTKHTTCEICEKMKRLQKKHQATVNMCNVTVKTDVTLCVCQTLRSIRSDRNIFKCLCMY